MAVVVFSSIFYIMYSGMMDTVSGNIVFQPSSIRLLKTQSKAVLEVKVRNTGNIRWDGAVVWGYDDGGKKIVLAIPPAQPGEEVYNSIEIPLGVSNIVLDASGNNVHATIYGTASWDTGVSGGSLNFDGVSGYLQSQQTPTVYFFDEQTISFWTRAAPSDNVYGMGWQAENVPGDTGENYYDGSILVRRALVGTHSPGYVCVVNVPSGVSGPFALTSYSRAGSQSSNVAFRYEVYEDGTLKWSQDIASLPTSYGWWETSTWFFDAGKSYQIKVYWPGNVDFYIDSLSILARRGGYGFISQAGYVSTVLFEVWSSKKCFVRYYTIKSDGTFDQITLSTEHSIPWDTAYHQTTVTLSNGLKCLYIDGAFKASVTGCGDILRTVGQFYVGSRWRNMYGNVDEFMSYKRALTDKEILFNKNNPGFPVTGGLILWYPMDEGKSTPFSFTVGKAYAFTVKAYALNGKTFESTFKVMCS
ncbi:MAG: LamG-like jellyroll fold domain-containing protein [Candidatus Bathyarchaeia archaeon]